MAVEKALISVIFDHVKRSMDSSLIRAPNSCKQKLRVRVPAGVAGYFFLQGQLSILTHKFRYPFHHRVTAVARGKIQVILTKVQAAGSS